MGGSDLTAICVGFKLKMGCYTILQKQVHSSECKGYEHF